MRNPPTGHWTPGPGTVKELHPDQVQEPGRGTSGKYRTGKDGVGSLGERKGAGRLVQVHRQGGGG